MPITDAVTADFEALTRTGYHVVNFTSEENGDSKILKIITREAEAELSFIDFLNVDVDKEPYLAEKYNIIVLPTTVFIRDGRVVGRYKGLTNQIDYMEYVGRAMYEDLEDYSGAAKQNPDLTDYSAGPENLEGHLPENLKYLAGHKKKKKNRF